MEIETDRLLLRPWNEKDAEDLYKYASNPKIGPVAGWPVHQSIDDSLHVIKNILSVPETYAVVLKKTNEPVGSIGILFNGQSNISLKPEEAEIGFWIGEPYWGKGLIPEAVNILLKYCFVTLKLKGIWCGYFEGNDKSKRVQEKCGFEFDHVDKNKLYLPMNDFRTEYFTYQSLEMWEKRTSYNCI